MPETLVNVSELSSPTTVAVKFVTVAQLRFVAPKSWAACSSKLGNPYGHKIDTSPVPDDSVRSSALRGNSFATNTSPAPTKAGPALLVAGYTGKSGEPVNPVM